MGSLEPLYMGPLGSVDLIAAGVIDSVINNINWGVVFASYLGS
ncbi:MULTISPECIES: hypothetical protein [Rhodococcus]|uniref:Uncharacterized protein n=1 Tax=Rhodococcus gannanensis TaxID=1960308 RepID=A0ABW4P015_9NOCA